MYREWNVFGRLRPALVHIQTTNKRSQPTSSTVLDVLSTVSARAGNRSVRVSWYARFTRVRSSNLSTKLRKTRTSSTVSPPVPTTVADPEQMADSEQIRVGTIALPTEQEKTRNLQEAQVLFVVLGLRCLLDCHVLKGFGIYMIGILDRLY